MRPVILKTGTTFPELAAQRGDYEDWFAKTAGRPLSDFHVVDATDPMAVYPEAAGIDGLLITGSPARVHDHEPWSVRAGEWAKLVVEAGIPTLGVCYGHQLLGDVFGGDVGLSPNGREMGVIDVTRLADDPLFEGIPEVFPTVLTHLDSVNKAPLGWKVLATNEQTPVQAMAWGKNCRTVQFHPEFDHEIIAFFIRARAELIDAERGPGTAKQWLANVRPIGTGPTILRNFLSHWLNFHPTVR
jgi:GMP synthase (glutamine-hydrolysing)